MDREIDLPRSEMGPRDLRPLLLLASAVAKLRPFLTSAINLKTSIQSNWIYFQ